MIVRPDLRRPPLRLLLSRHENPYTCVIAERRNVIISSFQMIGGPGITKMRPPVALPRLSAGCSRAQLPYVQVRAPPPDCAAPARRRASHRVRRKPEATATMTSRLAGGSARQAAG